MLERTKSAGAVAFSVLKDAARSFATDRGGRMAAAIAYRTIYATAPLLLLAVGIFGLVVGDSEEARDAVMANLAQVVGGEVAGAIELLVLSAIRSSDLTAILGFVLFAWTASTLFMEVQDSLNDVFGVPFEETAGVIGFIRRRAIGIAWSMSLGLLLAALWLFNVTWNWIASLLPDELNHLDRVLGWAARGVSLLMLPGLFYLVFRTMTRASVPRRAVILGSVFTAVAFLLTAVGAGLYFSWDAETSAPQVAASVFVLLLFSYLLSSVLLFGAQVTRAYHQHLESQ